MPTQHFQVLNLRPGASKADVRGAYLKLAKKWHPDANPSDPAAAAKFKAIGAAYDVLKDADKLLELQRRADGEAYGNGIGDGACDPGQDGGDQVAGGEHGGDPFVDPPQRPPPLIVPAGAPGRERSSRGSDQRF